MGQTLSSEQRKFLETIERGGTTNQVIEQLKTDAAVLDLQGEVGCLAMLVACHKGRTQIAEVLLLAGCGVASAAETPPPELFGDDTNITPLHAAAQGGHASCIRLCIQKGADIDAKTGLGRTVHDAAAQSGNVEAIRILNDAPKARTAYDERRNSAYTRSRLGFHRIQRQAIAVHVVDYIEGEKGAETQYVIESEDSFKSRFADDPSDPSARTIYYAHRTISDFKMLHRELCNEYTQMPPTSFSMAPKRHMSYSENVDRMQKLQEYLRQALSTVEKSAGGGYERFNRGRGDKPPRDVAELPIQLVMFLGLEDSGFSDNVRPVIQQLRNSPTPTPGGGPAADETAEEQKCPVQ